MGTIRYPGRSANWRWPYVAVATITRYIEYNDANAIEEIVRLIRERHLRMRELEITRVSNEEDNIRYCAIIGMRVSKKQLDEEIVKAITSINHVTTVEEL